MLYCSLLIDVFDVFEIENNSRAFYKANFLSTKYFSLYLESASFWYRNYLAFHALVDL